MEHGTKAYPLAAGNNSSTAPPPPKDRIPEPANNAPFRLTIAQVIASWQTDPHNGLTNVEARARLQRDGRNELPLEAPVPAWKKFLAQFKDVLVLLLLIATVISTALWLLERESSLPYEAIAIFAVVLLNAIMGYIQESRAESAVAALREMAAARAKVLREGTHQVIPAAEIVPGDVILIEEGDTIPADARLIQSTALQTAEATLTGESLPVSKTTEPLPETVGIGDQANMVFSGTSATYGHGRAVVTATGVHTEVGGIAGMLKDAPPETTPLQIELNRVGKRLGLVVVCIAVVMILTIILVEKVWALAALFEVLILGVALAVAAVPEGLPAVVTAVLALGVQRMAKRNAIVRRLAAVETLGSTNIIASDKTGTLTKNEMTVRAIVTAGGRIDFKGTGYSPQGDLVDSTGDILGELPLEIQRVLLVAHHANNSVLQEQDGRWTVLGDPTEGALLVAARKAGLQSESLHARHQRVGEVPFSSERKLMSTVHADSQVDRLLVFTKGAPDVLIARCTHELVGANHRVLTDSRKAEILQSNDQLASQALRTLAVAARELPADALDTMQVDQNLERELLFLGLIGMIDPPREEAVHAVARAKSAGIRPIMITGDHPKTAVMIASELGIATRESAVVTGTELQKTSDETLRRIVQETSVYARVNPEHKLRIVKALQAGGATVAMTGDGVNDAPALKTADIGIAMGITGTDVSKQAADVILTDDNFATIVAAVEEGRSIFSNIRKFLRYLLSSNIGEVMTMFFGVLLARFIGLHSEGDAVVLPLLATQILWINLVTDGAPALALGIDPPETGLMNNPPRSRREGVLTKTMWRGIFLVGTVMAIGTLLVLDASLPGGLIPGSGDLQYAQTMAFTTLMLFQLFNVFNARSDSDSAFCGLFQNLWLWGALSLSLALQFAVVYAPFLQKAFSTVSLAPQDWLKCLVVASSVVWIRELSKVFTRKRTLTRNEKTSSK
jgi:Ca2+-transporting ATPase